MTAGKGTIEPAPREFFAGVGIAACGDITVAWAYRQRSGKRDFTEGVGPSWPIAAHESPDALPMHLAKFSPLAVYVDTGSASGPDRLQAMAARIRACIAQPARLVSRQELTGGCEGILARTEVHPTRGDLLRVAHRMLLRDWYTAQARDRFAVAMLLAIYAMRMQGAEGALQPET